MENFMWVFSWRDFTLKDIIETINTELVMDEETNSKSIVRIIKDSKAEKDDIVVIKRKNQILFWGIVQEVSNVNGEEVYDITLKYITNLFDETVESDWESGVTNIIRTTGIEDFLKYTIDAHFINNDDEYIDREWLEVRCLTHTPLNISVTGVDNGIYNLHTFMTNCTQNYDIVYDFTIENGKLIMNISKKSQSSQIIDMKGDGITEYNEIFSTDIVAKVIVKSGTAGSYSRYSRYLLSDRTTTTNKNDPNRIFGTVKRVYTANSEDAEQTALNIFKSNSYSHSVEFKLNKWIPVGSPIKIRTKKSVILDTYISSVKITDSSFYEYKCGNMRTNFIDKLLKEKK